MNMPTIETFFVSAIAIGLIGSAGIAGISTEPAASTPSSVSANGFTLSSASIDLPMDDQLFPDGPHAEVVNANCASCHSASMVLNQPPFSADQWKAVVVKMRDVYQAPVADGDAPAILAYLTSMSADRRSQPKP